MGLGCFWAKLSPKSEVAIANSIWVRPYARQSERSKRGILERDRALQVGDAKGKMTENGFAFQMINTDWPARRFRPPGWLSAAALRLPGRRRRRSGQHRPNPSGSATP